MSWEIRNGKRVYYHKYRDGGHVMSAYMGSGARAQRFVQLFQLARSKRKAQREQDAQLDQVLGELERMAYALTRATLLAEGFHTHKGQWRKHRDPQKHR